jgi:hypothetical protein
MQPVKEQVQCQVKRKKELPGLQMYRQIYMHAHVSNLLPCQCVPVDVLKKYLLLDLKGRV